MKTGQTFVSAPLHKSVQVGLVELADVLVCFDLFVGQASPVQLREILFFFTDS